MAGAPRRRRARARSACRATRTWRPSHAAWSARSWMVALAWRKSNVGWAQREQGDFLLIAVRKMFAEILRKGRHFSLLCAFFVRTSFSREMLHTAADHQRRLSHHYTRFVDCTCFSHSSPRQTWFRLCGVAASFACARRSATPVPRSCTSVPRSCNPTAHGARSVLMVAIHYARRASKGISAKGTHLTEREETGQSDFALGLSGCRALLLANH